MSMNAHTQYMLDQISAAIGSAAGLVAMRATMEKRGEVDWVCGTVGIVTGVTVGGALMLLQRKLFD
ncbi:hypothetical protein pEaSNUABM54_00119 [Erwinia phage pEa_SNUABM_54]|nr:hypothetical protein pEaSNUABM54_00119 [Erwinia phage pEa_SNUABM_54]